MAERVCSSDAGRHVLPNGRISAKISRRYQFLGAGGTRIGDLSREYPEELNWERLSQDFGVPHPILARTYARELLNVRPLPMFGGYSSRLLAETWDSTNLYWARLADEMGYPPVMLNRLAPELTRRMVAKIFATDLNDWPAILRAMRETGEEFRQGKIASLPTNELLLSAVGARLGRKKSKGSASRTKVR